MLLTEWHIYGDGEWYANVLNEQDIPYTLALHRQLHPGTTFEVREKTYGDAS